MYFLDHRGQDDEGQWIYHLPEISEFINTYNARQTLKGREAVRAQYRKLAEAVMEVIGNLYLMDVSLCVFVGRPNAETKRGASG